MGTERMPRHTSNREKRPMGEFSPAHIIILLIVVLLVFGSKRLPEIARGVGSGIKEFKDGITGKDHDDDPPTKIDPPV